MWVDPDEDPRTSEGVSPDGELATLRDYLRNYRLTLQMKCEGLDPEKLARRFGAAVEHVLAGSAPPSCPRGSGPGATGFCRETQHRSCTERVMPTSTEPLQSRRWSRTHSPILLVNRRQQMQYWPSIRIWARGWVSGASLSGSCGFTGSRRTPATAGTPICCANAATPGEGNSTLPLEADPT